MSHIVLPQDSNILAESYQEWAQKHQDIYGAAIGIIWAFSLKHLGITPDKVQLKFRQMANEAHRNVIKDEVDNPEKFKRECSTLSRRVKMGIMDLKNIMAQNFYLLKKEIEKN